MFPAEKLVAAGGEIYCHLFENPRTGLPRNVYWSVTIDFHPMEYDGTRFKRCSMTCEWLTWPLRDWRQLEGRSLDLKHGDGGSELSFYLWEHHPGISTRLRIGARDGARFAVEMDMVVDFTGDFSGGPQSGAGRAGARAVALHRRHRVAGQPAAQAGHSSRDRERGRSLFGYDPAPGSAAVAPRLPAGPGARHLTRGPAQHVNVRSDGCSCGVSEGSRRARPEREQPFCSGWLRGHARLLQGRAGERLRA